jgi:hypothetical protein
MRMKTCISTLLICFLQMSIKHSLTFCTNLTMPYWIWGCVGTVVAVVLTFGDGLFFDRLARIVRIIVAGPRHAIVTDIEDEIVRIDIPCVRGGADPGKRAPMYITQHSTNSARRRTIRF